MADKLFASLRAGTYDAGAHILRTCSLPDLTSLVVPTEPQGVASPAWRAENESKKAASKVASHEGEVESPSGEDQVPSYSIQQGQEASGGSGEDDNAFDVASAAESKEGEGGSEGGSSGEEEEDDEDEWSSSGDEDLRQLVQTLQSFVEEVSEL